MNIDDDEGEFVKAQYLFNPTKQYLYQSLFHKVTFPDDNLPPLDPQIKDYLCPEIKIKPKIEGLMGDIKKTFNFKKN